jgi:preprotein translocase subunit YajC
MGVMQFAPFILIALFFLVMVLPQKRRMAKEAAARTAAMKPGAKVMTNSGIVGRIISMKEGEEEIVIKSEDTKLRIMKSTVTSVVSDETPAVETKA